MYQHFKTKAIFLKKVEQNEADFLFTLYTEDFGKIKAIAKAIRKPESKLAAASQLFYVSEIEFIEVKAGRILTDVFVLERPNFQSEEKLFVAFKISDYINKHFFEGVKDERVYQFILRVLRDLQKIPNEQEELKRFLANFLKGLEGCLGCSLKD
ncbi:DNA repair protein RecO [Candidatus Gribaldobacteria bacterium]|nr:DNA repair protein RecO [Candidatus Gribaldobacteria bacterium]